MSGTCLALERVLWKLRICVGLRERSKYELSLYEPSEMESTILKLACTQVCKESESLPDDRVGTCATSNRRIAMKACKLRYVMNILENITLFLK